MGVYGRQQPEGSGPTVMIHARPAGNSTQGRAISSPHRAVAARLIIKAVISLALPGSETKVKKPARFDLAGF